jgi:hypothetical protein
MIPSPGWGEEMGKGEAIASPSVTIRINYAWQFLSPLKEKI